MVSHKSPWWTSRPWPGSRVGAHSRDPRSRRQQISHLLALLKDLPGTGNAIRERDSAIAFLSALVVRVNGNRDFTCLTIRPRSYDQRWAAGQFPGKMGQSTLGDRDSRIRIGYRGTLPLTGTLARSARLPCHEWTRGRDE